MYKTIPKGTTQISQKVIPNMARKTTHLENKQGSKLLFIAIQLLPLKISRKTLP